MCMLYKRFYSLLDRLKVIIKPRNETNNEYLYREVNYGVWAFIVTVQDDAHDI